MITFFVLPFSCSFEVVPTMKYYIRLSIFENRWLWWRLYSSFPPQYCLSSIFLFCLRKMSNVMYPRWKFHIAIRIHTWLHPSSPSNGYYKRATVGWEKKLVYITFPRARLMEIGGTIKLIVPHCFSLIFPNSYVFLICVCAPTPNTLPCFFSSSTKQDFFAMWWWSVWCTN